MVDSNKQGSIPRNGTPCLYARKPPKAERARGNDDTILSSMHNNIMTRVNPMRIHVKTALPSNRSAQTMHIYSNEVKTMEDMTVMVIDVLGIHNIEPNEIELFYDGKYYMKYTTLFRDEDIVEVKRIGMNVSASKMKNVLCALTLLIITLTLIRRVSIMTPSTDVVISDL
jgi:hypothetical protein